MIDDVVSVVFWGRKNPLFWGKSGRSEAFLKIAVCLYSTGRYASMSVFHFVTVNLH